MGESASKRERGGRQSSGGGEGMRITQLKILKP